MTRVTAEIPARAALAGNPSDLYGGAVLGVPVRAFRARVEIVDAPELEIGGDAGGRRLVAAALARVGGHGIVEWTTDIPRQVGLAGSSALVLAALRAGLMHSGSTMTDLELALLTRAIEADELGIVAGLQDRAVQAAGQPVLVDVAGAAPHVEVLHPARPLRIAVAWLMRAAGDSGTYHRALATTRPSQSAMDELAAIARRAATAFSAGDASALIELMRASAEVRKQVAPLSTAHEQLADAVRAVGLSPNSAGSGGAVAAVLPDGQATAELRTRLDDIGADLVVETFA